MTLRVGIDATGWRNQRGDGRFVRNAVRALVELHPEVDWTLYADPATAESMEPGGAAAVRTVRQSRSPIDALNGNSSRRPLDILRLGLAVRRRGTDVFLSPSVVSYFPVLGVPSVVGLHDATAVTHSELILPRRRDRALWRAKRSLALRRAVRLFTVSDAARGAISRHLGIPPSMLAVVPEAPDPCFVSQPEPETDATLAGLGLSRQEGYLVFAAGLSPHKGLDTLLDAYAALRRRRHTAPPLVISGSPHGPYVSAATAVTARVRALGLTDAVLFPGFVSDRELACLYTGAQAAIVPSLSEGFGLAAVEAAACGTAVVLSDLGAHRETLGEAALFFPPGDADALRDRLERLLDGPGEREALGARARQAAVRLSWDETARRLYGLLIGAAGADRGVSADVDGARSLAS